MPERIEKGASCQSCFHCLTRIFHEANLLEAWIEEKELAEASRCDDWVAKVEMGESVKLYWCRLEEPIRPVETPPWWGRGHDDIHGCLECSMKK